MDGLVLAALARTTDETSEDVRGGKRKPMLHCLDGSTKPATSSLKISSAMLAPSSRARWPCPSKTVSRDTSALDGDPSGRSAHQGEVTGGPGAARTPKMLLTTAAGAPIIQRKGRARQLIRRPGHATGRGSVLVDGRCAQTSRKGGHPNGQVDRGLRACGYRGGGTRGLRGGRLRSRSSRNVRGLFLQQGPERRLRHGRQGPRGGEDH